MSSLTASINILLGLPVSSSPFLLCTNCVKTIWGAPISSGLDYWNSMLNIAERDLSKLQTTTHIIHPPWAVYCTYQSSPKHHTPSTSQQIFNPRTNIFSPLLNIAIGMKPNRFKITQKIIQISRQRFKRYTTSQVLYFLINPIYHTLSCLTDVQ